jgi:NTE family protein
MAMSVRSSSKQCDVVLEGGGVKGIALVGALSVLAEEGYRFGKVAGTSAGSIVGALLAADIPVDRLREMVATLEYGKFQDPPLLGRLGLPGMLVQVALHKGLCRGDYLRGWLREQLAEADVETFKQLRLDDPGADPALAGDADRDYRFVAMASDISNGRLARLPWDYRPRYGLDPDETPVVDAVRASMAIPYFFLPSRCQDVQAGKAAWLVDGGMLSNFPVAVFDRTDATVPRWPTFGIKLSNRPQANGHLNEVRGVISLSTAMLSTMTGFYDRMHVDDPQVTDRTIFVDTLGVRATDFHLDHDTAMRLYESGRGAAEKFLHGTADRPGWDFDRWLHTYRGTPADPAPRRRPTARAAR